MVLPMYLAATMVRQWLNSGNTKVVTKGVTDGCNYGGN